MVTKRTYKVDLTVEEKAQLRAAKFKIADLSSLSTDDIGSILNVAPVRAREINALITFQSIPSIGIKFAEDLISIGYYSLEELAIKDGPTLIHELETHCGYWIDPCVEDQCRLVVDYANNKDKTKNWWDFTAERKVYRVQNGYPATRPVKPWFETLGYKNE
ncbi:Pathogenicity locus [Flavipsychrobacter stenotrophus]|uniref:Pathogenicity locus n=1 Tax=Flavipsychrobacter stenotrophus TaxID=2077091 RepID=A0A2S7SS20_9BACT|nr:helix-hairpin-helix domain-containing protein [Flavipsychrobacter stenotrophus]PQJ09712.1 Pathogenicity locus [Flavipsychrobacter stenotrophus]